MFLGILDRNRKGSELKQDFLRVMEQRFPRKEGATLSIWANHHVAFCSAPFQIDILGEEPQPYISEDRSVIVAFQGKIYNISEIEQSLGRKNSYQRNCSGQALGDLYKKYRESFLDLVNGKYAFALWDEITHELIVGRDRLGVEQLYYWDDGKRLIFSPSLKAILSTGWIAKELNHKAMLQYLLYCYNPGDDTFLKNVYKLPAGHLLLTDGGKVSLRRYWYLSFAEAHVKSEEEYREETLNLIKDAIRVRLDDRQPPGIFLSGGIDSSALVSLTSRMSSERLQTFSFRCDAPSYDESAYARYIAECYGTQHCEIPYHPEDLFLISRAVEAMEEPFCDIGIEIGTYLLAQAAYGRVSYVFSGEGGDESFGGHPVYIADKLARIIDRVPRPFLSAVARVANKIPDGIEKNNLGVNLKRFAYGLSFPSALLTHRWRTYYTPRELQKLCTDNFIAGCDSQKLYEGIFKYTLEADGKDQLSRSLYTDYHTLVDFYLRRLELLELFPIESRLPLLDYRLVEYAAKIPSRLKIKGLSDTKYIYKKALEEVVPCKILYGRPKLGNSVPMKNWLRENTEVRKWMEEVLSDRSFRERRLFRTDFVRQMVDEHLQKTHNHSHKLWGLIVLELWLRSAGVSN